jgi:isocitrate/isopropylmalate dehydrogenase
LIVFILPGLLPVVETCQLGGFDMADLREVQITLVEGDGSAPETMAPAVKIVEKAAELDGIKIVWVLTPMGWCAYEKYGDTFPKESMDVATKIGIMFFGGVGDP